MRIWNRQQNRGSHVARERSRILSAAIASIERLEHRLVLSVSAPAAPGLLAATDSGVSSTDGITNFTNSSAANALQFSVAGTVSGASVQLYADGAVIGSMIASGPTTT